MGSGREHTDGGIINTEEDWNIIQKELELGVIWDEIQQ